MKRIGKLFLAYAFLILIVGCGSKNEDISAVPSAVEKRESEFVNTMQDTSLQFLLDASAEDFFVHNTLVPVDFRDVHAGFLLNRDDDRTCVLSGWVLTNCDGVKEEWLPFVTIQTSGYELWIGEKALNYIRDIQKDVEKTKDLSSLLQGKLDSLQLTSTTPRTKTL